MQSGQGAINRQMDKESVAYIHSGVLYSLKEE
jgi:hypothetical protein